MEAVTNKTLEKLKYDLVRAGLVQYETIEQAEEIAAAQNVNIGQVLINSGVLTEETILKFLEAKLHIPYVNLEDYTLDKKCLKYINFSDAKKYRIIPLFKIEDTLTVAMADPLDLFAIDRIIENAECSIEPVISSEARQSVQLNPLFHQKQVLIKKLMSTIRQILLSEKYLHKIKKPATIGVMNYTAKI